MSSTLGFPTLRLDTFYLLRSAPSDQHVDFVFEDTIHSPTNLIPLTYYVSLCIIVILRRLRICVIFPSQSHNLMFEFPSLTFVLLFLSLSLLLFFDLFVIFIDFPGQMLNVARWRVLVCVIEGFGFYHLAWLLGLRSVIAIKSTASE